MRDVTLCFLRKEDGICLAMKKRGFGEGKLNGVGGKVEERESVEDAAVREIAEEIRVSVKKEHLEKVAVIDFHFETRPDWSQRCHVFFIRTWEGEPEETEEMAPEWHPVDAIPFARMWADDPLWLPHALAGKRVEAMFHFSHDGKEVLKQNVRTV